VSELPVVFQYQQAFDEFRRGGGPAPLLKRMSELISLLDLTTTLNSRLSTDEILDAALLIVIGELQATRGCLFVRDEDGAYRLRASRGLAKEAPAELPADAVPLEEVATRASGTLRGTLDALGLEAICPIVKSGRTIALLGIGARADNRPFRSEDAGFLRSVAACAATPIENGLVYRELARLNQRLSVKVFQLRNLFDISRELTASFDEESIKNLVTSTLMGHLMVSRCVLYVEEATGLVLAHARGVRNQDLAAVVATAEAMPFLRALRATAPLRELPRGPLRDGLERAGLSMAVPLSGADRARGFLAVAERPSGAAFSEEDRDFAQTLGRQALAALETVRLHRIRLENERRDREMQIAREIQQSLFPSGHPDVPGFELAAESHPCQEVGGDHYDLIPLPEGRLALAVADVSGKGTPASILMASVHASLRALAGTAAPDVLMTRLNRFLLESTQENRYVTLFYGELDPASRRLAYVNAGHVPPYCLRGGTRRRLEAGGPVLGLLEEASYTVGEEPLGHGEVLAVVTDGVSEAASPDDVELGDERVFAALEESAKAPASDILRSLVETVHAWTGPRGCSDDLTAMVLKASER
jgi:phosphoserine phosphatase RsbU/P